MTNNTLMHSNVTPSNYRSAVNFNGQYPINTPAGVVHTPQSIAPPLPPRPMLMQQTQQAYSPYSQIGGFGNGMFGMNNFGYGMNSYCGGGIGGGGYGGYYNGNMNSYGNNPLDPDMRFIQMAEESSRGAFQSIGSIVATMGNIAAMLDSTYFALTSSFRAILGVAANFSQLRGFFTRFFSTFSLFRSVIWLYKKLLYACGITKTNPTQIDLQTIFREVESTENQNDFFNSNNRPLTAPNTSSGWPMFLFISFIFAAPYVIMKIFGSLTNSINDQHKNPTSWKNAVEAVALYNFQTEQPSELPIIAGQKLMIAPREIQQANHLLHTSWLLASTDGITSGLVPVNYIQRLQSEQTNNVNNVPNKPETTEPVLIDNKDDAPPDVTTVDA